MVAQIFSFLFQVSNHSPNRCCCFFFCYYICTTEGVAETNEPNKIFIITNTTFAVGLCKERRGRQETKSTKWTRARRTEQRKMSWLQQHSSGVRHLLFYCNLMALLFTGATGQSPLYHMAIILVVLLCDLLSLSTVTRDP